MIKYFDINEAGHSIKCKIYGENLRELEHIVLFLHGFGGHKDNKAAQHFADAALSKMKKTAVMTFDWPCHGKDVKKKLTLADCDTYLSIIVEYIKEKLNVTDIYAYATSFGGYQTLRYIHYHSNPFNRIALRCPAISMGEVMMGRIMTEQNKVLLEKGKDVTAGFDRKVLIDKSFLDSLMDEDIRKWEYFDYAEDICIIHGKKDEIVPIEVSSKFAEDNVIEFIAVDDADHRFQNLDTMKLAHSYIVNFFQEK